MNVWDILILLALGAAAAFALRHIVKQRKQGGCGGNCSGCSAPCAEKGAQARRDDDPTDRESGRPSVRK